MRARRLTITALGALTALGLVAATLAGTLQPASAGRPQPDPLGENLVENPGAESGDASDGARIAIPGWHTFGGFTAVEYGSPGFPRAVHSEAIEGGANFFAGGPDSSNARAVQNIDISNRAPLVDRERLRVILKAQQAGFRDQTDFGRVVLNFKAGNGRLLGSIRMAPVAGTNEMFVARRRSAAVPAKTRTLQVVLLAIGREGDYNDAYFDNIEVRLARKPRAG